MDADKIKNFFIFHGEKIVVVLLVAVAGFLVYSGLSLPLFLKTKQPDALAQEAKQVRSSIDENHNEAVLEERIPTFDIVARTVKSTSPVNSEDYKLVNVWEPKSIDGSIRRTDVELLAPIELNVQGVLAPIAVKSNAGEYELTSLEAADKVEKAEPKPAPRSRGRGRNADPYGEGGGYGGSGYSEEDMMMMMGQYPSSPGESMSGPGGMGRKLDTDFDFGLRPPSVGTDGKKPVPETGWFIAGTAVMPHKELSEAYNLALKDADGYNPLRDRPIYYNLEVQRADVTDRDVDAVADEDWVLRGNRAIYLSRAIRTWAGFAPELVPAEFRDDALTSYIPPVLLDDYSTFALHPLVPLTVAKTTTVVKPTLDEPVAAPLLPGQEAPELKFSLPGMQSGSSYQSSGSMSGSSYDSYSGGSGYGMGGGVEVKPVDYKLIRFYDFVDPADKGSPKLDRRYVYRIRVSVVDPNFPMDPALQPRGSTLTADVYRRTSELTAKAAQAGTSTRPPELFQRWSEWSQPSEPVSLAPPEKFFVGPVTAGNVKPMKVNNRTIQYVRQEPTAKMITSQYSFKYKTRVPLLMDVTDGTVLSATGTAEVVDPITLEIKKIPDASIVSSTTVIDLEGGQPLEISPGEEMTQPAMMLLFDEHGGLTVTDEVSDQEFYRIYSYADERGE